MMSHPHGISGLAVGISQELELGLYVCAECISNIAITFQSILCTTSNHPAIDSFIRTSLNQGDINSFIHPPEAQNPTRSNPKEPATDRYLGVSGSEAREVREEAGRSSAAAVSRTRSPLRQRVRCRKESTIENCQWAGLGMRFVRC